MSAALKGVVIALFLCAAASAKEVPWWEREETPWKASAAEARAAGEAAGKPCVLLVNCDGGIL